jgi:hypothetical protein
MQISGVPRHRDLALAVGGRPDLVVSALPVKLVAVRLELLSKLAHPHPPKSEPKPRQDRIPACAVKPEACDAMIAA